MFVGPASVICWGGAWRKQERSGWGVEWVQRAQEGEGSGGQESAEEFGSYSELRASHWQFQVVEYFFPDLTFSKGHVNCCVENGTQVFRSDVQSQLGVVEVAQARGDADSDKKQ